MFPVNVTSTPSQWGDDDGNQAAVATTPRPRDWFNYYWAYRIFAVFLFRNIVPIIFSTFGLVSNIISIIIFYRQGPLGDSCTTSLVGVAVADFGNCLIRVMTISAQAPYDFILLQPDTIRKPSAVYGYKVGFFLQKQELFFTNITCWITAYIGLERMISVTFPFHVKRIFTPTRTCLVIACIYVVCFLFLVPHILAHRMAYLNLTGIVYAYGVWANVIPYPIFLNISFVTMVCLRSICLCLIVVFNATIIFKVNISSKFRKSTTGSSGVPDNPKKSTKGSDNASTKEDKLTKMMVVVSVFLVICLVPNATAQIIIREQYEGRLKDLPLIVNYLFFVMLKTTEALNCSCNMIFYYVMSGKFKKEFLRLFQSCRRQAVRSDERQQ